MKKEARFDRGELRLDAAKTPEGYLRALALMSKTGVFEYRAQDGSVRRELRHPDDVFSKASIDSAKNCPITVEHPQDMVDSTNVQVLSVGNVGDDVHVDAPYIAGTVTVRAQTGVDAVERGGKKELSYGYWLELEEVSGVYDGQTYTHRQRNIRYNHLALTSQARLGPELRISMDAAYAVRTEGAARLDSNPEKETTMLVKITLDSGLSYDAAPEVGKAFEKLKADLKAAQDSLESEKTARTKAEAERDSAKSAQDKAEKDLKTERDGFDAKVQAAAKDRADLMAIAARALEGDALKAVEGKDALEVKKAVILAVDPDAKLDGKDAAYIQPYFDSVVRRLPAAEANEDGLAGLRGKTAPQTAGDGSGTNLDAAAKKFREQRQNAWKHPQGKKE